MSSFSFNFLQPINFNFVCIFVKFHFLSFLTMVQKISWVVAINDLLASFILLQIVFVVNKHANFMIMLNLYIHKIAFYAWRKVNKS